MKTPVVEITLFMLAVYLGFAWTYYTFGMSKNITAEQIRRFLS